VYKRQDENGESKLNLHYIYDVGLIDELIKWSEKGNFDRASSLLVGMFYMMDLISKPVVKQEVQESHDSFFNREFFS
jgi:hypothetical protein